MPVARTKEPERADSGPCIPRPPQRRRSVAVAVSVRISITRPPIPRPYYPERTVHAAPPVLSDGQPALVLQRHRCVSRGRPGPSEARMLCDRQDAVSVLHRSRRARRFGIQHLTGRGWPGFGPGWTVVSEVSIGRSDGRGDGPRRRNPWCANSHASPSTHGVVPTILHDRRVSVVVGAFPPEG